MYNPGTTVTSILLLFYVQVQYSVVVGNPQNIAVVQGQTATFGCTVNQSGFARWDYYPLGVNKPQTVWNTRRIGDTALGNRSSVNAVQCQNQSRCDLIIANVQLNDAGTLVCREAGRNVDFQATLIVLEAEPVCEMNASNDQPVGFNETVLITCDVKYSGSWTPQIHCYVEGLPDLGLTKQVNVTSSSVAYWTSFEARTDVNNKRIVCTTNFDVNFSRLAIKVSSNSATNTPSYRHAWTSPLIRVANKHLIDLQTTADTRTTSSLPTTTTTTTTTPTFLPKPTTPRSNDFSPILALVTPAQQTLAPAEDNMSTSTAKSFGGLNEVTVIVLGAMGLFVIMIIAMACIVTIALRKRQAPVVVVQGGTATGTGTLLPPAPGEPRYVHDERMLPPTYHLEDAYLPPVEPIGCQVQMRMQRPLPSYPIRESSTNHYSEIHVTSDEPQQLSTTTTTKTPPVYSAAIKDSKPIIDLDEHHSMHVYDEVKQITPPTHTYGNASTAKLSSSAPSSPAPPVAAIYVAPTETIYMTPDPAANVKCITSAAEDCQTRAELTLTEA